MDKFQEFFENIQSTMLDIFDNELEILNSENKTAEEKVESLKQYVKEQHSILFEDMYIHKGKIIELADLRRKTSSTN